MEAFLSAFNQSRQGGNLFLSGSGKEEALSSDAEGAAFQINVSDLSCKTPQL